MTIATLRTLLVVTALLPQCCDSDLSKAKGFDIKISTKKPATTSQSRDTGDDVTENRQDGSSVQGGWAPEVTMHILDVLEQVHNKLSGWEVRMNGFETQLAAVKVEMSSMRDEVAQNVEVKELKKQILEEIKSVKENFHEKIDIVAREGKELRSQILAVEQRQGNLMSTEVDNLENRLKLFWTQRGQSPFGDKFIETKQGVVPLDNVKTGSVRKELVEFSNKIVSNITDGLTKLREAIDCEVPGLLENEKKTLGAIIRGDEKLEKLAKTFENQIFNYTTEFYKQVRTDLSTVEEELRESLVNQSATLEQIVATNAKLQDLKSTLKDAVNPQSCKKGMLAIPNSIIYPSETSVIAVPYVCDTQTEDGGWIVFHRRVTGSVSFNRNWADYRNGFGNLNGDFWLGLEAVHNLTSTGIYELRIDLRYEGQSAYARYSTFRIASESEKYVLQIGDYSGTAGDSLSRHKWMAFTTPDKDNDKYSGNCGSLYSGGWWWGGCGKKILPEWCVGFNW